MNIEEKIKLIKRNIVELVTEEELRDLLEKKENPSVYIGTAITGKPHIGYFMWVLKMADLIKAGFNVKILLADLHGALDNCPWDVLEKRYKYYEKAIPLMFDSLDVDLSKMEFIKGSSYQLSKDYCFDLLRMSSFASIRDCRKAASEVVKNIEGDRAKLSGLIYPIMQTLDEEYLKVDMQFGATDQRKIFMFARENHPKLGYKPRIELMGPMIPGLIGKKMSASDEKSKIDLLDSPEVIKKKLRNAECVEGNCDNGIMAFLKYIIMTIKSDKNEKFIVEREEKYGGNLIYENYSEIEKDFISKKLHPLDLKNALAKEMVNLLKPFEKNRAVLEKLSREAY